MAGLYEGLEPIDPTAPAPRLPAAAPRVPKSLYEGLEPAGPAQKARPAVGLRENVYAGLQGSAPGLMWRGKLPSLFTDPETATWWERAVSSFAHVGAELGLMVPGAMVGGAAGSAVGGPLGGLLGAGFGMGVVPATIRTSLTEAYKAGEAKEPADWFNIVREVAKAALKEGGINAAAMGAGAVVGRAVGAAVLPKVAVPVQAASGRATQMSVLGTATEAADLTTQIATMVTMPAIIDQRLPKFHEFLDAAILIGGLKAAHVTASRVMHVYQTTGKTPAEQVADAKADPTIAADLTREPRPPVDPVTGTTSGVPVKLDRIIAEAEFLARGGVPEAPSIRQLIAEIKAEGPLQGDMIRDIDRIGAMYDKARLEPLTDPERAELEVLKGRVAELEAKVRAEGIDAIAPVVQRHTEAQVAEAKAMAEKRLAELAREAEGRALTDAERAERVFLTNAKPEALAKRFGLEPAGEVRLTAKTIEEGAQRVHDDVLQQLRDVDQTRRDSGLQPLGDDHAVAVAALVRARVRARATRLGRLPEEIYAERPLQIRDETAAEVKAAEEAIPAGAPTFIPPEVDLFGMPIEAPMVPRLAVENLATVEVPLERLVLSKEVPQFKHAADEKGVVAALGGKFDRTGVGPIQVWERLDGTLEVISGRHRLDLARRSGEQTIPAQVHREADGFDARRAATLDAELNIREEQGSVADYAQYFKDSGLSKEAADERGLLARAKGRSGFAIARDGTPDLIASLRAGRLSDEAALSIAVAAPQSEAMQALGMRMVLDGQPILIAVNMMKAAELAVADRMAKGEQGDLWGFDDSAIKAQLQMAKRASAMQRKIGEQIAAVIGAAKRPELAKKMGVDVQDPEGIKKKVLELRQTQELWDNWPMHPELVAQLRAPEVTGREGDLKQGPVDEKSPEFRAWFGNSKVVDAEGRPLVVYRGLREPFKNPEVAQYWTDETESANNYAGAGFGEGQDGANVVPAYLSIKKPFMLVDDKAARHLAKMVGAKWDETIPYFDIFDNYESVGALKKAGYDGVVMEDGDGIINHMTYITFEPTQIKSVFNRGTFDPNDPNILRQEPFDLKPETPAELEAKNAEAAAQARRQMAREDAAERAAAGKTVKVDQGDLFSTQGVLFQRERGSYNIAEKLITTMQGADKSTVIHELGHDWLQEMKEDAARPDAPEQLKADWEILRRELAIGEDGEIQRASHEQFARGVERYLMEGEAPSVALRTVFERFKAWLLEIYQSVMNLNVNINPDLRAVMDRMLATDQEIADARAMDVPRAYVAEAKAQEARKIVPGFKAEQVSLEPYADELPKGPGEAPDNSHVNYAYINSPLDVKLTMQRMAEIDQANIQKQRGGVEGVKSWADANAEQARYVNDILGGSEDTLKLLSPRDPNAPGPDVKLGILKKLAVGAAKDSARLRDIVLEKGHDATIREQLEYMGSIERARMIQAEFLGERASVARALNALKDTTEGSGEIGRMLDAIGYGEAAARGDVLFQDPTGRPKMTPAEEQALLKAKLDEILLNYKGRSVLDIAKLHKEIGTLKGTFKFAKEVTAATKWEMVVEGWKASLLSGPVTHTTNLFGTGAFQALRAPVDALAAIIGVARGASPGMGVTDRAAMSEAVAGLTAYLTGISEGLKVAKATFDLDNPTGKTEAYRTAIPGRAGELIRVPLRLMGAEDALIGTMYQRKELAQLAIRQAFNEGLNPATKEFAIRVDHLKDNPTPEMTLAADAARDRMTFNMPLGEKGVYLQLFVNKWNLQWMIPFIRTPINITKEVARMSPFAPLVGEWRADIAKGGVARDKALAEVALGSGIMALTVAYAFAGNISGGGSPDPGKNRGKAGVEQPYSIKIGDTWYEYARIQPTGTLMGLAADMALVWDHMTDEEKDKVPKLLSRAFANAVTNQTFLQGITNVINAMSEPARFAPKFLQQMAGSMVPNVIGQPTAMADPTVREVNSALEAIMARVPGMRETLMPKRDWLGEPVQTKERLGVVGPVRTLKVSDDKVRTEAARLDISMAAAPRKAHIGKGTGKLGDVELTPEERNKFQEVGGQMAHRILAGIVNQPGYDALPPLVQKQIFSKVLTASHRVAAVAALPPDKRVAYLQSITEKVQAELSSADQ